MPKIMDTHDSLTLEQEYKGTVGVFKEADKVTSATDEMLDLHRIAYKACENFQILFKMSYISGILVQNGNTGVPNV